MEHSFLDQYSTGNSFIHRLDPRIKLISFVACVFFVVLTPATSFLSFMLYAALGLVFVQLSRLPVGFLMRRLLFVVSFACIIAAGIPFLTKGTIVDTFSFGPLRLTVTFEGLLIFWNVIIKSLLASLMMIMLTSTTRFPDVLKALEWFRCPRLITMILSFMYRYIFVLIDELMKMQQAKQARSVRGNRWFQVKALANMIGVLFIRAYERGERVYLAMCARGFDGSVKTAHQSQMRLSDICFLTIVSIFMFGIRVFGGA